MGGQRLERGVDVGRLQAADQRRRGARRNARGVRPVARRRRGQVPRGDRSLVMQALVKTARGVGYLELQDRPEPVPAPGWVTIAVRYAGICGTDLHIVQDEFPYWPPVTLGHEFFGTVAELGQGVDRSWLGARVVSEPHSLACGTCHLCRR